jgi:hypothetical protein
MKDLEVISKDFKFGRLHFLIEKLLEGYVHPCSISDVENLIESLPVKDMKGISFVVFHQPTRKEEIASPRWAFYNPEFSHEKLSGSAIFLEAVNPSKPLKWKNSLTPEDQKELELLQLEGHVISREKKFILVSMDASSVRRTQLERSFIHELGHHVDYKDDPINFSTKTKSQKESFANKYYNQLISQLTKD